MKFTWPLGFEIPDALWVEAGMLRFRPRGLFYRSDTLSSRDQGALTLSSVQPPTRNPGIPLFDDKRLRDIFRAFALDESLPPIDVFATDHRPYRYRMRDGFHRFYASAAVGYTCIPINVVDPPLEFDTNSLPSAG